jgi:hypothetical protein
MYSLTRVVADTLFPINATFTKNGAPLPLSSYTVKAYMKAQVSGTVILNDTATGITQEPTQTFTVDTSLDVLKCNDHGVKEGQQVVLASTTTIPAGLTAGVRYFAVQIQANWFGVSLTQGGAPIDITSAGTGTHTFYVVGSAQYDLSTTAAATAGKYRFWFRAFDGSSEVATFPQSAEGINLTLVDRAN